MHAQFIAVEGLEGAGKSSAIDFLVSALNKAGIKRIVKTREPGGTPLAEKIRHLVKADSDGETVLPQTELLLMYASRVQHVEHVIKPALEVGDWVICDRFELSTWAYQGGGRGIAEEIIAMISQVALQGFSPDFTLYLDIDPALGLQRVGKRGALDRIEQESLEFFQRIRARYLALANVDLNIVIIDASQELAAVQQAIKTALKQHYPDLNWNEK